MWDLTNNKGLGIRVKTEQDGEMEIQAPQFKWKSELTSDPQKSPGRGEKRVYPRRKVDVRTSWPSSWKSVTGSEVKIKWTGCLFKKLLGLSWQSMVKTSPSNAGGAGLIPGQGAKTLHDSWPKKTKTYKQEQYCNKFNKNFKTGPPPKEEAAAAAKILSPLGIIWRNSSKLLPHPPCLFWGIFQNSQL